MSYFEKYLKYKNKYLSKGGGREEDSFFYLIVESSKQLYPEPNPNDSESLILPKLIWHGYKDGPSFYKYVSNFNNSSYLDVIVSMLKRKIKSRANDKDIYLNNDDKKFCTPYDIHDTERYNDILNDITFNNSDDESSRIKYAEQIFKNTMTILVDIIKISVNINVGSNIYKFIHKNTDRVINIIQKKGRIFEPSSTEKLEDDKKFSGLSEDMTIDKKL